MKRLLTICSGLVLVTSISVTSAGTRTYAAQQAAPPAAAATTVRLCSSAPLGVPALTKLVQGIFNGVKLATVQMRPAFKQAGLVLQDPLTLDDALPDGTSYGTEQERRNALNCLGSPGTIGYVGTLNSGAAVVSEPILNRQGMVMISPSNSGVVLTCPRPAVRAAQEPATYSHRLKFPTYYRTVTTDALQGPGDAAYMHTTLHVNKYYLLDDKLTYGAGLAAAFKAYASTIGMSLVGQGHIDSKDIGTSTDTVADQVAAAHPDGVFFGGDSETGLALPRRLRAKGFTGPLMGGDATFNSDWIKNAGPKGAINNFASSFGPDPATTGASFRRAYQKRFHVPFQAYEATAYDAARIILQATLQARRAGKLPIGRIAAERKAILPFVAHIKYFGAIGKTTFDKNGDTTNRILSLYKVVNGAWVYTGRAPHVATNPTNGC